MLIFSFFIICKYNKKFFNKKVQIHFFIRKFLCIFVLLKKYTTMEKLKSLPLVGKVYNGRTMDIIKNDEGKIEFHEMWNDKKEGEHIPSKIVKWVTVKWCAENGRLRPDDINEFIGEEVSDPDGIYTISKLKVRTAEDIMGIDIPIGEAPKRGRKKKEDVAPVEGSIPVGSTMLYSGKSKKLTSTFVSVVADNGDKVKVKDEAGNEVVVVKTALKFVS